MALRAITNEISNQHSNQQQRQSSKRRRKDYSQFTEPQATEYADLTVGANKGGRPGVDITQISTIATEDTSEDVFLACIVTGETLGAATMSSSSNKLCVMGRTRCPAAELRMLLSALVAICHPTCIVIHSKADEHFTSCLRAVLDLQHSYTNDNGGHNDVAPVPVVVLPSASWDYASCMRRLSAIQFSGIEIGPLGHASLKRLSLPALLDTSNHAGVQAAGAVLQYSHKALMIPMIPAPPAGIKMGQRGIRTAIEASSTQSQAAVVPSIFEMFTLNDFLCFDHQTLRSLDIIRPEEHPSVVRGRGRNKEGFSVMSLLDRCASTAGRRMLRWWLQKPLASVAGIERRQEVVATLMDPSHGAEARRMIVANMRLIKDVPRLLLRVRRAVASAKDFVALAESTSAILLIKQTVGILLNPTSQSSSSCNEQSLRNGLGVDSSFLRDVFSQGTAQLIEVQQILSIIDWAESKTSGTVCIVPGFDAHLDTLRERLRGLTYTLEHVDQNILPDVYGSSADRMQTTYIPQVGYVIGVTENAAGAGSTPVAPFCPPTDFEWVFSEAPQPDDIYPEDENSSLDGAGGGESGGNRVVCTNYFKNDDMRHLDREWGDVAMDLREREIELTRVLEVEIIKREGALLVAAHRCAELDVLCSFAIVSQEMNYSRPLVLEKCATLVKQGRHPLQELALDDDAQFVPNDFGLAPGSKDGGVMILTGPNYSGKSVLLKTVGVLTVMAQVGCFVPAEKAVIGIVDRLFTRIDSQETSSAILESSFTLDVQQVAYMLRHATSRSLLLIDEFGKGTNTSCGASLLAATIKHILSAGTTPHLPINEYAPALEAAAKSATKTPRTVITTHFHEIFRNSLLGNIPGIVACEMQVIFENGDDDGAYDGDKVKMPVPLFVCKRDRVASNSYGIGCAQRANLPSNVVKRAAEIRKLLLEGSEFGLAPRFLPPVNVVRNFFIVYQ